MTSWGPREGQPWRLFSLSGFCCFALDEGAAVQVDGRALLQAPAFYSGD